MGSKPGTDILETQLCVVHLNRDSFDQRRQMLVESGALLFQQQLLEDLFLDFVKLLLVGPNLFLDQKDMVAVLRIHDSADGPGSQGIKTGKFLRAI